MVQITRRNRFTGITETRNIPFTPAQRNDHIFNGKTLAQAFPGLSQVDLDFLDSAEKPNDLSPEDRFDRVRATRDEKLPWEYLP